MRYPDLAISWSRFLCQRNALGVVIEAKELMSVKHKQTISFRLSLELNVAIALLCDFILYNSWAKHQ